MRLGVVGLCGDFRTLTSDEIANIKALEFTGLSFHFRSAEIPSVPPEACNRCVQTLEAAQSRRLWINRTSARRENSVRESKRPANRRRK